MLRLRGALESPVWGSGLGVASPGSGRLLPETSFAAPVRTGESFKPSESFMAALISDTGVPGLLLFYLLLAMLMRQGLLAVRACRGTDLGLLAAAILVFEIAILIHSWAYDPLHYPPSRVFFWLWAGVLLALPKLATTAMPRPASSPRQRVPVRRLTRPELAPGRRRAAV